MLFTCIIIPEAQCKQQHLYIGVRVGISAKYRTGSTPSSGKKSNSFTAHEYSLCKEKIHLRLHLQTLYFLRKVMCNLVWNSFSSQGQMVRSLTSCCVVKIPALRRTSSCAPVTPVKDESDLCLSMSFTQDNNSTLFPNLLWSRRS